MSNLKNQRINFRGSSTIMKQEFKDVQKSYEEVAAEYVKRISGELEHRPLCRQLFDRCAATVRGLGLICDLGCVPGHVARYLHDHDSPPWSPNTLNPVSLSPLDGEIPSPEPGDFLDLRQRLLLEFRLFGLLCGLNYCTAVHSCVRKAWLFSHFLIPWPDKVPILRIGRK